MTSSTKNARKRKQTTIPETDVSSDDDQNKSKSRRVSPDASESAAASLQMTEAASVANTATTTIDTPEASMELIGALIQLLAHSDNARVNAAFDAFSLDFMRDEKKLEGFVTAGCCFVLVQLLKKCLVKAINSIPACDQVTELNELAELTTLRKTLGVITNLIFHHEGSRVGISTIGGVEALVKVIKTFSKVPSLAGGCVWRPAQLGRVQYWQDESHRIGWNRGSHFTCIPGSVVVPTVL